MPTPDGPVDRSTANPLGPLGWIVLAVGLPALLVAVALAPHDAVAAAGQDWTPFVLVAGLLLVGLVARDDGLFDAGGALMARAAGGGWTLFAGSAVLVAMVTAVLNLDTAVAFLTPVLVVAARRRQTGEAPFLYLAVFLANGASLLLPGSNLTNLIVLGHRHLSGAAFAGTMIAAWAAACLVVPAVLAVAFRRSLRTAGPRTDRWVRPQAGVGLVAVAGAVVTALALTGPAMALVALGIGLLATVWRGAQHRLTVAQLRRTVDLPVLVGLFGLAVALGALGRAWSGPQWLLAHASSWEAAAIGAVTSVLCNNLPAASLLATRPPADPQALLIGLDLGPNLAVTGALSAVLWLQVARPLGARPSVRRYTLLGLVVAPVSMAAALGALTLSR
ncbi:MAG TPA: SLC13 family permease [Acidimicrobiales bacterium]|nr:SLC13 family permease [Acidimicrobiales bacterium]